MRVADHQHSTISDQRLPVMPVSSETAPLAPVNRRSEFRLGTLLILFAHACDFVSTYIRTPDLSREVGAGYLLLAHWGFGGWAAVIALKATAVVLSVLLFLFYVRSRRVFYPQERGLSFHEFLHRTHSHKAVRRADGSWMMPSPRLLGVWASFTIAIGSAAYAYFLAMHNLIATPLLLWGATSVVPGIIFFVTAVLFWRSLYDDYQRLQSRG